MGHPRGNARKYFLWLPRGGKGSEPSQGCAERTFFSEKLKRPDGGVMVAGSLLKPERIAPRLRNASVRCIQALEKILEYLARTQNRQDQENQMATVEKDQRSKEEARKESERRDKTDRREKQKRADQRRLAGYGEIIPDRRVKTRRQIERRLATSPKRARRGRPVPASKRSATPT